MRTESQVHKRKNMFRRNITEEHLITLFAEFIDPSHSTSDPIPDHFRFTSGSLGLHRWPYDVSHNSIFQKKLNFAKFADGHTDGKKVTSKDPFR